MPLDPIAPRAALALVLLGGLALALAARSAADDDAAPPAPAPAPADAPAPPPAAPALLTGPSPIVLLRAARLLDPDASVDEELPGRIWFALGDQRMTLTDQGGGSITFLHGFDGRGIQAGAASAWNQERRFARCYQRDDGTLWLQMDVLLRGGVTVEHLAEQTYLWRALFLGYVEHLRKFSTE